jgi:hypothetical protein
MTEQEKKAMRQALEALKNLASDLGKLEDEVPSIAELQSILNKQPTSFDDPLFWYRPRSDGYYEGPIHNARIEKARRESGAWHPLYTRPWSPKNWMPIELSGVAKTIKEGVGFWRACTGCHELNEGHDTGPFSKVFECALGNGCDECGGIGAIWDVTDYEDMARTWYDDAPEQPAAQWVGLTDKQIEAMWDHGMYVHCSGITALRAITRAIEAAHRIGGEE